MEHNFYTDDEFEQFLKAATEDFRMYPSRKVWHSLYNDLHPARKWPSLAVSLLLITAILFVGISNNNSINNKNGYAKARLIAMKMDVAAAENNKPATKDQKEFSDVLGFGIKLPLSTNNNTQKSAGTNTLNIGSLLPQAVPYYTQDVAPAALAVAEREQPLAENQHTITISSVDVNAELSHRRSTAPTTLISSTTSVNAGSTFSSTVDKIADDNALIASELQAETDSSLVVAPKPIAPSIKDFKPALQDKAWIENYAFENRRSVSRLKSFANMQYYATTSLGFRKLQQKPAAAAAFDARQNLVATNAAAPSVNVNDGVTQKSAMNMEIGAALLYNMSKRIRIKAGVQFNYTNYVSLADKLNHPTETAILLNTSGDYTLQPRISDYVNTVNGEKNYKLNNTTLQLSMPVGADFKIAGKNKLKWYAGATVQPSYITGGNVFALSADSKNYVEEDGLLRKWNMNTSIETFLSYKTSAGVIINFGPQVRYQLMSTYNSQYGYTEKLYNLGLKLGFTKSF